MAHASRVRRSATGWTWQVLSSTPTSSPRGWRRHEHSRTVAGWRRTTRCWRCGAGPAWAGLAADVAQGEALRLEDGRLAAREERAELLLKLGRTREAADELRQLVAEQPLRDRRPCC